MPSTRAQPLNPRAPKPPESAATALRPPPRNDREETRADVEERDRAQRAGAFHESSYELRTGLEINESEWPEEITIPAALGKD